MNALPKRILRGLKGLALFTLLPLVACAQSQAIRNSDAQAPLRAPDTWQSALYLDHPLVGRIWRASDDQFVSGAELAQAIDGSRFVLLGEKHDNPDHHHLQAAMLDYLLRRDRVAAVSFEMMDTGFAARLTDADRLRTLTLAELKDALQWDEEGWNWDFYGPLIERALQAEVTVTPANLTGEAMGRVYAEPLPAAIAEVLDAAAREQLDQEIDASHCGLLPASQFPAMVRVQQARDHQMATSLAATDIPGRLNLLIAGNYHVRKDLGVPRYLLALRPEADAGDVLSIALLEVDPESEIPGDYLQAFSAQPPFDYVWFTPAISDEDYCASLVRE